MATPPSPSFLKTAEADSSTKPGDAVSSKNERKGFSRWISFTAIGILVLAGAVACLFLIRNHRARRAKIAVSATPSASGAASNAALIAPTVELPLDPFVVNLADAGGHSYARIGLTLQLAATPAATGKSEKKDAAGDLSGPRDMVRDTVITVLNQEQSADLLAPGGKQHLKQAISAAVAARDSRVKVADIYFTEFLVQR